MTAASGFLMLQERREGRDGSGTNRRAALPPLLCSSLFMLKQRHDVAVEGLHGGRELEERCFAYHLIINCRVYLGADRSTSCEEGNTTGTKMLTVVHPPSPRQRTDVGA